MLGQFGLRAEIVSDLAAVPREAKVLVIGPGTFRSAEASWATKLGEFVAAGGSVVCLAQDLYPARWLPVEVEIDAKHRATIAFARARSHPALAGITDEDLRFWQPDHVVASRSLLKPTCGNFIPLIDAGGIRGAIHDMNGLNWVLLLELPYGRGRYLLCQLPLVERSGVEPAADHLLRQLLRYAAGPGPAAPARVGLLADPESSLKHALDGMGLVYDSLLGSLDRETLRACQVLIAGGGPAAWKVVRGQAPALREWVERGGVLWLNRLTPDEADVPRSLLDAPCELRPADVAPMCLAEPDALTTGMSNHELYWRDRPIWDQMTAIRRIMDFQLAALPPTAKRLTDPPGLARVPVGRGCVLINQLLWDSTQQNRLDGLRIASILLTNLGAPIGQSPFQPVSAESFHPIDIAAHCNLGFSGDPGSGWMDHGPGALAQFPVGRQALAGALFNIIGPNDNRGKSLIALRGATRPGYPAAVSGIRVGIRARAIHFLHTCAWGRPDGSEAAAYVVHYEDGAAHRVPLRIGVEIADWYADPVPLPSARVAWKGHITDKPGPIGVHAMRWVNPYPEKVISTVASLMLGMNNAIHGGWVKMILDSCFAAKRNRLEGQAQM